MRPVIGITASTVRASWGAWTDQVSLLPDAYVTAVRGAGGRAVLLPAGDAGSELAGLLDGLVLAGGADVGPARYGQPQSEHTVAVDAGQDESELELLRSAAARDLPVLGVCRGMQLLAVANGGRLHQHLPGATGHETHGAWNGKWSEHRVELATGSLAHRLIGDEVVVNSGHHQGVADAGTLTVSGRSPDGLAEAIEDPDRSFLLGVQWHPEMIAMTELFDALVSASAAGAAVHERGDGGLGRGSVTGQGR